MGYIDKINKHVKFSLEDIKAFCIDQVNQMGLQSYVESTELTKTIDSCATSKENDKTICISINMKKYYLFFQKENTSFLDRVLMNDADLYNLYVIYVIFHELWHFKQKKELTENPNGFRSLLLKSSKIFVKSSFNFSEDNRLDNLISGYPISVELIEKLLFFGSGGKNKTINIIEELQPKYDYKKSL